MDRSELCGSLIIWLDTFREGQKTDTSPEDLTDGVLMSQALHQIDKKFFSESWMSKVKVDTTANWRLKVSNLKKILNGILNYYSEVLGQQIHDFHMPDITAVGERSDPVEMSRLLQLILGCAVNCEAKQEYIQRIMGMEESVQHMVMQAIQELMTKEAPAGKEEGQGEVMEQLKKTVEEMNKVVEEKEELAQRCHELDQQIAALQDEKLSVETENERLSERVNQADSLEDPSTPAGRRYQQLQTQVEQLQEELYRQESGKEDLRIKVELQEKEILDLQQKGEDLSALAEEARHLKDEVDVLRHTADKVTKYEATIDTYKKKLEELSDLKGQIKILEDKNTTYMQTNMDLEEETRKLSTYKSQLELYKRQVQELQLKSSEETKRADKAEFEAKRQADKMQTVVREKERLSEENLSLKDTIEELRGTRAQQELLELSDKTPSHSEPVPYNMLTAETLLGDSDPDLEGGLGLGPLHPAVKERLLRLERENARLQKARVEEESAQLVQGMLDDANVRTNELETEVRILNQRILELTAQLEDLQETQEKAAISKDSSSAELRAKLTEHMTRAKQLEVQLHTKAQALEEAESRTVAADDRTQSLTVALERKEDEIKAVEERYKKYLEKAKSVINSLDPKKNLGSGPEILALRNQISEKERLIDHMERDQEKVKSIREQEEKLMVTAWYNLGQRLNLQGLDLRMRDKRHQSFLDKQRAGMQLHRKAAEERLVNSGAGQSFLAKQRQVQTRRTAATVTSPPRLTNMAGAR